MLFVESRTAERFVEKSSRLGVLEGLQARGRVPLIRSARLHCFEQTLAGEAGPGELERALAEWQDAEGDEPYVRGEVFFAEDHACFLIFTDPEENGGGRVRAGVVYDAATDRPGEKLEAFCRDVGEAAESVTGRPEAEDGSRVFVTAPHFEWRQPEGSGPGPGARAAGGGAGELPDAGHAFPTAEGARVAEVLEDAAARGLLRRLTEARAGGGVGAPLAAAAHDAEHDELVARLAGAGLVRREVQVSCRKDGRSLFRLPSAEALSIVTASNAVCSECGLAIADERAEELLTPTPLAATMLQGGTWLADRMRAALLGLGLRGRDVSALHADGEGAAHLVARVCGEPFLFVLNDGDFAAGQARRALDAEAETQATRLFVVSTGRVYDDARARLREFARRRARAGGEAEVHFVENVEDAAGELAEVAERVTRQALSRELFELDAAAGFNVGRLIAARFALGGREGAAADVAASAAGAHAGSFGEG